MSQKVVETPPTDTKMKPDLSIAISSTGNL